MEKCKAQYARTREINRYNGGGIFVVGNVRRIERAEYTTEIDVPCVGSVYVSPAGIAFRNCASICTPFDSRLISIATGGSA